MRGWIPAFGSPDKEGASCQRDDTPTLPPASPIHLGRASWSSCSRRVSGAATAAAGAQSLLRARWPSCAPVFFCVVGFAAVLGPSSRPTPRPSGNYPAPEGAAVGSRTGRFDYCSAPMRLDGICVAAYLWGADFAVVGLTAVLIGGFMGTYSASCRIFRGENRRRHHAAGRHPTRVSLYPSCDHVPIVLRPGFRILCWCSGSGNGSPMPASRGDKPSRSARRNMSRRYGLGARTTTICSNDPA